METFIQRLIEFIGNFAILSGQRPEVCGENPERCAAVGKDQGWGRWRNPLISWFMFHEKKWPEHGHIIILTPFNRQELAKKTTLKSHFWWSTNGMPTSICPFWEIAPCSEQPAMVPFLRHQWKPLSCNSQLTWPPSAPRSPFACPRSGTRIPVGSPADVGLGMAGMEGFSWTMWNLRDIMKKMNAIARIPEVSAVMKEPTALGKRSTKGHHYASLFGQIPG